MLAQVVPETPTSVLAAVIWLGSVMVGGLLLALRTLWSDNRRIQNELNMQMKENSELSQELLSKTLEVTVDSRNRLVESARTIEVATNAITTFMGQQLSPEVIHELTYQLRRLRTPSNE